MWQLRDGYFYDDEFPFQNFVTTRSLGDMKDAAFRAEICSLNKIDLKGLVFAEQVHGSVVAEVGIQQGGTFVKQTDGLISSDSNVSLAVFTADCLPVFLGARGKAVGVVHAGWRGLFKGIIADAVKLFKKEFNILPPEISASLGPHICERCYEIGAEIRQAFGLPETQMNFSLAREAAAQLNKAGINKVNVCGRCTCHETDLFFSYRADKTQSRIMSLAAFSKRENA